MPTYPSVPEDPDPRVALIPVMKQLVKNVGSLDNMMRQVRQELMILNESLKGANQVLDWDRDPLSIYSPDARDLAQDPDA
jgi:hypothetical protein